jgi:hypothetical protein
VDFGIGRRAQVIGHNDLDRATEFAKGALMQLGPDARARLKGEEPDAFAAVAERQHEQPRAAVLAVVGIANRGTRAVVDLRFLAGSVAEFLVTGNKRHSQVTGRRQKS